MNTGTISLSPADPEQHFAAIANLMNTQETEPNSAQSLTEWYFKHLAEGMWFTVAIDPQDEIVGFSGLYRSYLNRERCYSTYLVVDEQARLRGIGRQLYSGLLEKATQVGARTLRARVRDTSEEGLHFATRRGFEVKKHAIEMMFDLKGWDERRYQPIVARLEQHGFLFTNMAELGDTHEARQKLYKLNNEASATDPGSDGIAPWASFEEFDQDVCSSPWYRPEAQIIAIDTASGNWAAMSAITVFEGADHAYNLFTGTDIHYRGRKLAQAVKSLALRKACEFGVDTVRTSHNSENAAMIAIDEKLGYVRTPGMFILEKELESPLDHQPL